MAARRMALELGFGPATVRLRHKAPACRRTGGTEVIPTAKAGGASILDIPGACAPVPTICPVSAERVAASTRSRMSRKPSECGNQERAKEQMRRAASPPLTTRSGELDDTLFCDSLSALVGAPSRLDASRSAAHQALRTALVRQPLPPPQAGYKPLSLAGLRCLTCNPCNLQGLQRDARVTRPTPRPISFRSLTRLPSEQ